MRLGDLWFRLEVSARRQKNHELFRTQRVWFVQRPKGPEMEDHLSGNTAIRPARIDPHAPGVRKQEGPVAVGSVGG